VPGKVKLRERSCYKQKKQKKSFKTERLTNEYVIETVKRIVKREQKEKSQKKDQQNRMEEEKFTSRSLAKGSLKNERANAMKFITHCVTKYLLRFRFQQVQKLNTKNLLVLLNFVQSSVLQ
jgi:hypothetical protein